jgi:hypothetical protein
MPGSDAGMFYTEIVLAAVAWIVGIGAPFVESTGMESPDG